MQIQMGHVYVDPRTLDKRPYFTDTHDVDIQIFESCDVKKPVFLLSQWTDWETSCNYMYIPAWGTYYFLGDPDILDGHRCRFSGVLDELTTYADGIKDLTAYLTRTADTAHENKLLPDKNRPVQANRKMRTIQFNRSPFSVNYAEDNCFMLTVIGGNHGT